MLFHVEYYHKYWRAEATLLFYYYVILSYKVKKTRKSDKGHAGQVCIWKYSRTPIKRPPSGKW